ncbi:Endochitinase 1 [Verticillium nonalfalfae]|uniref:chitinase n=1 Tax=Verticillium nonalfalfae TaxID=1051616 RepID=A0A3M9Y5N8_9PEZI|nr:Endochitinase 1 [Verticillium nonalfalfae]RNJ55591.1 Endochitinase 1 [Verticillium nonalfalfae]
MKFSILLSALAVTPALAVPTFGSRSPSSSSYSYSYSYGSRNNSHSDSHSDSSHYGSSSSSSSNDNNSNDCDDDSSSNNNDQSSKSGLNNGLNNGQSKYPTDTYIVNPAGKSGTGYGSNSDNQYSNGYRTNGYGKGRVSSDGNRPSSGSGNNPWNGPGSLGSKTWNGPGNNPWSNPDKGFGGKGLSDSSGRTPGSGSGSTPGSGSGSTPGSGSGSTPGSGSGRTPGSGSGSTPGGGFGNNPGSGSGNGFGKGFGDPASQGHRNVLYVTNWGIYGANYQPDQIPADKITHINYAFANIQDDGTVFSADPWADTQKGFPGDNTTEPGNNAYGLVKQIYQKKIENRGLKVLLSIGGWTWSPKFPPIVADDKKRAQFVASAVKLITDWGMDGIDVDWEYPNTPALNKQCVILFQELRQALDEYSAKHANGYHFLLTFAAPAGPQNYGAFDFAAMDKNLDYWSLMAYDFAGSWDNTTGHASNVFPNPFNPTSTKFSINKALDDYIKGGVAPGKFNLGIPLYGRGFNNTDGMGKPYHGVPVDSLGNQGTLTYKYLPLPGAKVEFDPIAQGTYSYDSKTRQLYSFDDIKSAGVKTDYLQFRGLGGAMYWEASGDKTGDESIVSYVAKKIGLEKSQNLVWYPVSQYDNIRGNLGQTVAKQS